jgi:hypothetical protein
LPDFFDFYFYFVLLQLLNSYASFHKATQNSWQETGVSVGNGLHGVCRFEFLLNLFHPFFILFFYSYGIHMRVFERLCQMVGKLVNFL